MVRAILVAVLLCTAGAKAGHKPGPKPGDDPTDPFAQARKATEKSVVQQLEPDLPPDLLVGEVSIPASFSPEEDDEIRAQWRRTPKEGNAFALVELVRDGKVQRRTFVRVELLAVHEVLVAQRDLAKGDIITRGDLELEPRIGGEGIALASISLVGAAVLDAVEAGQAIDGSTVELPTPIARGTAVKVVIRVGGARIESHGRLEASARPGERVHVRVRATRKIVKGLLIDHKTVELDPEGA